MKILEKKPVVVTGLDIGSTKVSAVAAEIDKDGILTILAQASVPSKGVFRGSFSDINEGIDSVIKALTKLKEKIAPRGLGNIYVNSSGQTIKAEKTRGMIPLSMRGREITKSDIEKCINVASTIQLPYDRDIIHKIVVNYSVDDQPSIRNPLGLYASRLACEMYVISAAINHMENIHKCVNEAGYDIKEIVYTGIADGMSLLNEEDKEAGAVILNVGASLTEVSFYSQGVLNDMQIIPLGRLDLKGDLKDSFELSDLIGRIRSKMDEFVKKGGKLGLVVLTGGLAFEDGIIELMEAKLSCRVKMGIPRAIKGDISSVDSIRLATALGLIRYGEERYRVKTVQAKNLLQHVSSRVVDLFNNYF
jgi:cell division ATPase FtsA